MKVWIDQDLCTGDGICVEICPSLFDMHEDGLAYVKEAFGRLFTDPMVPRRVNLPYGWRRGRR